MIQERKPIKTYNQMVAAYEASCDKISKRYSEEIGKLTQDSVKTLCNLFHSYLTQKKAISNCCQSTHVKSTLESSTKSGPNASQHIFQVNDIHYVDYGGQSFPKKKDKENMNNENYVISKQINKLNLNQDFLLMEDEEQEEEDSPTKKYPMEDLKNKNLAEIIMQSQRKVQEKIGQKQQEETIQNEDSDYEMTDYSSNQSSNQGSYQAHYAQQISNKPLFGGLFSKTFSSDSHSSSTSTNLLNFNFSSKQLLKSPKKIPKSKRLYIGTKKIPKWAEDLGQIQKNRVKQSIDARALYGKCIVQHIDTNIIFQGQKEGINRTSSAKWNSQIFLT